MPFFAHPYPHARTPLCCTYPVPPLLGMHIRNDALKEMIRKAMEQKNTQPFQGDDVSTVTAHFLAELLLQDTSFMETTYQYKNLYWALSTTIETRILLIVRIIDQLELLYPNKNERITLVSVGSGQLLQEYLLIRALQFRGFHRVELNTVDPHNHIEKLHLVLLNDESSEGVSLKHYPSAMEFITEKKPEPNYKTDVCLMVSYQVISFLDPRPGYVEENILNRTFNRLSFYLKERGHSDNINLFIPYDINQSYLWTNTTTLPEVTQQLTHSINTDIEATNDFLSGIAMTVQKISPPSMVMGLDDIWVSFFDIIRTTGHADTLNYVAFHDSIEQYTLVNEFPYWDLIPHERPKVIWPYNPFIRQFAPMQESEAKNTFWGHWHKRNTPSLRYYF